MDFGIRILIVDDMPAMRSILRGMLEEVGFRSISDAEDGEAAWHLMQQAAQNPREAFALVIADWNMPGMSGIELVRAVRNHPETRGAKFLMVTSQGSESRVSEALRAGVNEYVVKPFNGQQLAEKITSALS